MMQYKIINYLSILILTSILILFIIIGISFSGKYSSAFEADQACHAELWDASQTGEGYGCDHDIETHQWLLFKSSINNEADLVIKRFRYNSFL